jgi:hypothetical protein
MSTSGPELPPHLLAKRKRKAEEEEAARASLSTDSNSNASRPSTSDGTEKRQRVIGPALPPAAIGERPTLAPDDSGEEDSSSEDEIGPSLPSASRQIARMTPVLVNRKLTGTGPCCSTTENGTARGYSKGRS